MTYIQIITAIGLICSDQGLNYYVSTQPRSSLKCKRSIIDCIEQEKRKDKEEIKLYEVYFKACIIKEINK